MATRKSDPDPRLEDVQRRVDEIRHRLPENPGTTIIPPDHVPPDMRDGVPDEGIRSTDLDGVDDSAEG